MICPNCGKKGLYSLEDLVASMWYIYRETTKAERKACARPVEEIARSLEVIRTITAAIRTQSKFDLPQTSAS